MITVIRKFPFDAAHRIIGHSGKCKNLHGHRYEMEVMLTFNKLDELGMGIDFAVVKERIKAWIDLYWDHNVILERRDHELIDIINKTTGQNVFILDISTSAENIALYFKNKVIPELFKDFEICTTSVRIYETPNCSVIV